MFSPISKDRPLADPPDEQGGGDPFNVPDSDAVFNILVAQAVSDHTLKAMSHHWRDMNEFIALM